MRPVLLHTEIWIPLAMVELLRSVGLWELNISNSHFSFN
jgi:hypothetical protein